MLRPYAFVPASATVLHLLHEAMAGAILTVVVVMLIHFGATTVLRVHLASTGIEEITGKNPFLRRVMKLYRLVFSAILRLSHGFYKRFELEVLEKFNRVLSDVVGGICAKLALKLDVVADYYAAITWFIAGALASITILLLIR